MYGLSRSHTVTPPTTALRTTTQNWAHAPRSTGREGSRCSRAAMMSQPTTAHSAPVSSLLPNSIAPCTPISAVGARLWPVHEGHSGQPSPDPVTRTTPPVTMINTAATTDVTAAVRRLRGPQVWRRANQDSGVRTTTPCRRCAVSPSATLAGPLGGRFRWCGVRVGSDGEALGTRTPGLAGRGRHLHQRGEQAGSGPRFRSGSSACGAVGRRAAVPTAGVSRTPRLRGYGGRPRGGAAARRSRRRVR